MKITIITATYNVQSALQITANSIRSQSYSNIEWLVVDGGSTDQTLDVINRNSDIISFWMSEPDSGIYDAWNKICPKISGDWVLFLGAGDTLASSDVLSLVAPSLSVSFPKHLLVYGKIRLVSEINREVIEERGESWDYMKNKWEFFRPKLPMHPEIFHHSSLLKSEQPFDKTYKIAADTLFLLSVVRLNEPLFIPIVITEMPFGGVSSRFDHVFRVANEVLRINKQLGIKPPLGHYLIEKTKILVKLILIKFVPLVVSHRVVNIYRRLTGREKKWGVD